ncbi:MAG: ATP-dependent zinc protease [Flavobacteriales bacterium]
MNQAPVTIGRREFVDLPELDAFGIEAKVDTGAFRTAVHCERCAETVRDGRTVLEAAVNLDGKGERSFFFDTYTLRTIKNSFGQTERRYCVKLLIRIGRKKIRSDVSFSDRSGMKYPVLIGRKTIGHKFLVDVSRVHAFRRKK